jgi:hypothetical protein
MASRRHVGRHLAGEDAGAPRTFQFNCGGRGAKTLKEKPSAVTLPLVTEK